MSSEILKTQGTQILDAKGNVVLLRGVSYVHVLFSPFDCLWF